MSIAIPAGAYERVESDYRYQLVVEACTSGALLDDRQYEIIPSNKTHDSSTSTKQETQVQFAGMLSGSVIA